MLTTYQLTSHTFPFGLQHHTAPRQSNRRPGKSDPSVPHMAVPNRPCTRQDRSRAKGSVSRDRCWGPRLLPYFRYLLPSKTASRRAGSGPKDRTEMSVTRAGRPPQVVRGSWPSEVSPSPSALQHDGKPPPCMCMRL